MSYEIIAPRFATAVRFWWLLGWISFGGPAGQIAVMHREVVERRRWVTESDFLHGLNFCMLLPGPEAMQLAIYLGWRLHGNRGGLTAGLLFVLPALVLLAVLAWLYLQFGQTDLASGVVMGLSAAVLALLVQALQRLGQRVLNKPFSLVLAAFALIALAVFDLGFPWIIASALVIGMAVGRWRPGWLPGSGHGALAEVAVSEPPRIGPAVRLAALLLLAWWLPLLAVRASLGEHSTAWALSTFFSKASLVTFGGAYAVLPYVAQQAVEVQGWLSAQQMLVGLGLAETTPGPLIIVLEYVGFLAGWQQPDLPSVLASALLAAAVTVWATFVPSFLFVLPAAPWIARLRDQPRLSAALSAITAAVIGVIAHLAGWFGYHVFASSQAFDALFIALTAVSCYLALARWHWQVLMTVLCAGVLGLAWVWLLSLL